MGTMLRVPPHYRATPESIRQAIQTNRAERELVRQQTGFTVTDAPIVIDPALVARELIADEPIPRIVLAHCTVGNCLYVAGGSSEGETLDKLERHLSRKHGIRAPQAVA